MIGVKKFSSFLMKIKELQFLSNEGLFVTFAQLYPK